MRRVSAIAALCGALMLPSGLRAQFRSASRAAAPRFAAPRVAAPRMGFSGFRGAAPVRTPFRAARFTAPVRGPRPFGGRPFPGRRRFFPHPHFFQTPFSPGFNSFGFPTSFFYAFGPPYYYPPYTDEGENDNYQPAAAAEPEQAPADDALAEQVQALTDEVAALRDQGGGRLSPPARQAAEASSFEEKTVPAVFVYRDGHQLEAENYAIMGQTLWVFGEAGITRKVSLADLDLAQTRKLNDERGIDFVPPQLR